MRVKISSLCDSSHRWFSLKLISSLLFPFLILIFERSAEYSEFFAMGRDRLVIPGGVLDAAPTIEERPKEKDANPNGNGAGQTPPTLPTPPRHPFIEGLLQTLPDPEKDWPAAGREKWLQTAANIFDLIYKGDGGIKIELAMAQRSPRPSE